MTPKKQVNEERPAERPRPEAPQASSQNPDDGSAAPPGRQSIDDTSRSLTIILAEDDEAFRKMLATALRRKTHEVIECRDGIELAQMITAFIKPYEKPQIDLIISDIRMPGVTGMTVLDGLRNLGHDIPVILLTAFGDEETHTKAKELGARLVLDKPFEIDALLSKVREVA